MYANFFRKFVLSLQISLTDEAERRHKAKSEAIYLAAAQKEAELIAPGIGETTATPTPKQRSLSPQNVNDEDDGNNLIIHTIAPYT